MTTFASFTEILPDPINKIADTGAAGSIPGAGFASVKLYSDNKVMKSKSLERQLVDYHKWSVDITYNPMTRAEFDPIYSFLLQKRTTGEPFYVALPQFAAQSLGDVDIPGVAGKGAPTLLAISTSISPGDLFLAQEKAYLVTRVETNSEYLDTDTAPPIGETRLHITPPLQTHLIGTFVLGTDVLSFTSPKLKVVQVGDVLGTSLNTNNLYSFSLKLEEVRA